MSKELVDRLKAICTAAAFDAFSDSVYLKNAVIVGHTPTGPVVCTYINRNVNKYWGTDQFWMHVNFNERDCDLYGKDHDFTSVGFLEEYGCQPTFLTGKIFGDERDYSLEHPHITILPNALELISAELDASGEEWLKYQTELRRKSREYRGRCQTQSPRKEWTWEERLEYTRIQAETDHLMHRRPINHDRKRYEEMLAMGQEEWDKKEAKQTAAFKKIFDEMEADGKFKKPDWL